MAAGPGPLQVIAAAVAVYVQHLAAGVEAGDKNTRPERPGRVLRRFNACSMKTVPE